jgi:serine/threonine-protein kinase RsbW
VTATSQAAQGDGYGWELTARPQDVELWRKEVAVAVAALGGDRDGVELAQLGVSELLTNALKHVDDPACRLEVYRDRGGIWVRLFDRSRGVPAVLAPDWETESGRGLWLLREMADGLGYVLTASGKWVWIRISLPGPGQVAA